MITVEDLRLRIEKELQEGSLLKDSWILADSISGQTPIAGIEINEKKELILIELC